MKKVSFVFVIFALFMFVACGDADPKPASIDGDENEVSDNEGGNQTVEDGETENDSEVVPEPDEATTSDEENVSDDEPVEEPDETEEPDGNNDPVNPGFDVIGNFNLSFNGPVHESVGMDSMMNLGGDGSAEFVYKDQPITFSKINIGISLFPMAMINNGIVIVWLDSFSMGDLSGTVEKQVFGINLPQNTEVGSGEMANANMYAFYGDMTVNVKGGQFEIKCVRTVTNVGNYNVTANDGSNLSMTASGDLLDPAAGAAYLPYPPCE
ncbi:hypothetical protein J5681_02270 [bacterium]|nr:hypothetical protein [bacterium]